MKPGTYIVRGNDHGAKTDKVSVAVSEVDPGAFVAAFTWQGVAWKYTPRKMSPNPERLEPKRAMLDLQQTATSIAKAAFEAAKKAAEDAAALAEHEEVASPSDDYDDETVMLAMRRRSAGPDEGRYTRSSR